MATELGVKNAALREIGERNLTSLTEAVEARYVIDDVYDIVLADCLDAGLWNFAVREVQLDSDTGIDPGFGYNHVFAKPSDWVRTVALSADESRQIALEQYSDRVTNWSADVDPIYVDYVSNGASYGLSLTNWPRPFTRYVELALAERICERLTQNASKAEIIKRDKKEALLLAKSHDAMNEAQPRYAPMGSWNSARTGGGSRRDRGNRGSLIG